MSPQKREQAQKARPASVPNPPHGAVALHERDITAAIDPILEHARTDIQDPGEVADMQGVHRLGIVLWKGRPPAGDVRRCERVTNHARLGARIGRCADPLT